MARNAKKPDPKVPSITLAGKTWPIPKLVPRQMREVHGPLVELNRRMGEAQKAGKPLLGVFSDLSRDDYDALLLKPIYWALTRAHPDLEWDEFLDMEGIEDGELTEAWFVVREQSRIFIAKRQEASDEPGEAKAARTKSPTGT